MADISSITLPGGGTYDLKDKNAVPRYGKGVNLLRNWYFVGGGTGRGVFPVNQRGQSSYATVDYTVDGWKLRSTGSSVVVNSGSITFNRGSGERADFFQILGTALVSQIYGKPVVLSILLGDGRFRSASFIWSSSSANRIEESDFNFSAGGIPSSGANFSTFYIRLFGTSIDIVAIQLELGTEQTLAHQENGVWVLNDIPDYEYELFRCITSTADPFDTYANKSLATRQDLTSIQATGTTNTTGAAIPAGAYFYLNGVLHRAKTQIDVNATFTVNTNCEQVTGGGLNNVGFIDISSYIRVNLSRLNNAKIKARYYPGSKKVELQAEGTVATTLSAAQNTLFTVTSPYAPPSGEQQFAGCGVKNSQTPVAVWASSAAINAQHGGASVGDKIAISLSWLLG